MAVEKSISGPVVRKVVSAIQRIVIFLTAEEGRGVLNSQEIVSDLNSKVLNFNMGFSSY